MEQKSQQKGLIYLLMGYLGSGKTTFIRNVLTNKAGKKYAIIQNEFASGQMGIEQPLIMDESGIPFSDFLQLPNGCICCSAKNDLVASIEYILNNTAVRNIIVETNGLADPAESIKQFWFDEQMKINGYLHSVISIFSIKKFEQLQGKQLFQKQIIFANKVMTIYQQNVQALLTFIDKSTENQVQTFQSYIKENNPECQIKRNNDFDIVSFLDGPNIFDITTMNSLQPQQQTHSHSHKKHHNIHSLFFKGKCTLKTKNQVQVSLGELLWQSGLKVLRIKGVYSLDSEQKVLQLQGVDDLFEIKQTKTQKSKYQHETRILVIGQNIEAEYARIKKILEIQ